MVIEEGNIWTILEKTSRKAELIEDYHKKKQV